MQTRAFNSISVDEINNIFKKSSNNIEKLKNEIFYYLHLPKELVNFFPRLINYKEDFSAYELEYIPYNSLKELILTKKIPQNQSKNILSTLIHILEKFHSIKPPFSTPNADIATFYIKKTKDRIEDLKRNPFFNTILSEPFLKINGINYKNFTLLEKDFSNLIRRCSRKNYTVSTIHGDFCFSNILYFPSSQSIKLIDPRGSFTHKGIYGHHLYDYAKLMHCVHGRYDFLVNDLFQLYKINPTSFYFEIPSSAFVDEMEESYINLLVDKGFDLKFIYLIEASLFLSMASLHYENPERQIVFYLTGITILNHILEGKYAHMY